MASSARRVLRVSIAALALCAGATPALAQTTALFLDSQPGDGIGQGIEHLYTPVDGSFTLTEGFHNGVRVSFSRPGDSWSLFFHGPNDEPLQPGAYHGALRAPFTPFTGLDVGGDGRGCNTLTGRFVVREIVYAGDTVERLAIDFEQHCGDGAPALFGAVRYNSTISTLVPFDGAYPTYRFEVIPRDHGTVSGSGLECGGSGGTCALTLSAPADVTVTATPDFGYMFAGWDGTCYGGMTMSYRVNTIERCSARFVPAAVGEPTLASLISQAGEPVGKGAIEIFNIENSRWSVTVPFAAQLGGSVLIDLEGMGAERTSHWRLTFRAPSATPFVPGFYESVSGANAGASISVSSNSSACNSASGTFTVHEVTIVEGVVTKLALDFEARCGVVQTPPAPLRGSVRYNSSVPPSSTLAVRVDGSRGHVRLAPGPLCTENCVETYLSGTVVELLPEPAFGYRFDAWSGDADCADGTVTMGAPLACEATFAPVLSTVSVTPSSGTGSLQLFSLDYASAAGADDIVSAWAWFNPTLAATSANSCLVYYHQPTNHLRLLNDAGTIWNEIPMGGGTLGNSQCSVLAHMSSVTSIGSVLRVNLTVHFQRRFAPSLRVYMFAANGAGATTGWQERGSWFLPVVEARTVSVQPSTGSGTSQQFALTYESDYRTDEVARAWVWFNAARTPSAAGSCLAYFDNGANRVFLLNDAATVWTSGTPGSGAILHNSQCAIQLDASSVVRDPTTLTVNLAVIFKSAFAGTQNIYMFVQNVYGRVNGWHQHGTWEVPTPPALVVSAVGAAPSGGSGAAQTFLLDYTHSHGALNLATAWAWFTPAFGASSANSCLVYYEAATHSLFLLNDAGTVWQPGTPGGTGTLQNSRCAIAVADSAATFEGTTLRLTLALTFTAAHAGPLNVFMYAAGPGAASGWHDRGDWTVTTGPPSGVTADAVTPDAGTGTIQTFAFDYSSTTGAADLRTVWVWFNATFGASSAGSCLLYYDRSTDTIFLLNDAGTAWQPASPGSAVTLQNSQCALDVGGTSVALNGNTLTLAVPMTFTPAYAGAKQVYLFAATAGGAVSGWVDRGDWLVP